MHVVIPVRPGRENESLRYALRAWHAIYPEVEVTVIGGKPFWYTGRHVQTVQRVGPQYQWTENFPRALRAAVAVSDGPFWWSADDIFPLVRVPLEPVPTWCRLSDLDVYLEKWAKARPLGYTRAFVEGMRGQRDILRALGVDTQDNADIHLPHLLDPDKITTLLDMLATDFPDHPAGHFRAIYGGLWPDNIQRVKDPKVTGNTPMDAFSPFVSTCHSSWVGFTGRSLRKRLPHPSPWEK